MVSTYPRNFELRNMPGGTRFLPAEEDGSWKKFSGLGRMDEDPHCHGSWDAFKIVGVRYGVAEKAFIVILQHDYSNEEDEVQVQERIRLSSIYKNRALVRTTSSLESDKAKQLSISLSPTAVTIRRRF